MNNTEEDEKKELEIVGRYKSTREHDEQHERMGENVPLQRDYDFLQHVGKWKLENKMGKKIWRCFRWVEVL